MPHHSSTHRVPRARHDPIRTAAAALAVVNLARSAHRRDEIIAFLLDNAMCGTGIIVNVTDAHEADAVVDVAEVMAQSAHGHERAGTSVAAIILASVRPDAGLEDDDGARWRRLSDLVDDHGLTLVEWFVLGRDSVVYPRDLLGEPDRWPRS